MPNLSAVYAELRDILRTHAAGLDIKIDNGTEFYLDTWHVLKNRKPLYFGSVQIKKHYVIYHLMPVYVEPALLKGMTNALAKRMQGKSCFNFTEADDALFKELEALTAAGLGSYRAQGFIQEG